MRCAAAMAYLSVRKNDRVEIALLRGTRAERLCEPVSGVNAFYQLMKLMDDIDFAGDTDIPAAVSDDPQPGAADGMTVIVSDFLTGSDWKRAIDHLLSRGRIVSLIQVLAP